MSEFKTKFNQDAIPKFETHVKAGDFVQYIPLYGGKKRYGVVKRIAEDGKRAFVWYHSGCTAAGTKLSDLYKDEEQPQHKDVHRGCEYCL